MSLSTERYSHKFEEFEVFQRKGDGYFDGTSMCKVGKKFFNDWRRLKSTDSFLAALSSNTGIPVLKLVVVIVGGNHIGSWIHPEVAIHLAMWINPEFAVQVTRWTFRFMSGDLSLVQELVQQHEAVNPGRHVRATVTAAGPETSTDDLDELHRNNASQQTEITNLKARVVELVSRGEETIITITTLQRSNTDLTTSNNELMIFNKDLTTTNNKLTTFNTELTMFNNELITTNDELKTSNNKLMTFNEDLTTTNNKLTTFNTELTMFNNELATTNEELTTTNAELATSNTELVAFKKNAHMNHQLEIRNAKRATAKVKVEFEGVVADLRNQVDIQSQQVVETTIELLELQHALEDVQTRYNATVVKNTRLQEAGNALYEQYHIGMATLQQIAGDGTQPAAYPEGEHAEQPLATSKPTRYIGLHTVTVSSNGQYHRLIRDINRDTLDSIGQNLSRYFAMCPAMTKEAKLDVVQAIVQYVFPANQNHSFISSVACRTVVYAAVKARFKLQYCTHCNLGDMYGIVCRANAWARHQNLSGEFILCQERDLELLLGKRALDQLNGATLLQYTQERQQPTMTQHFSPAPIMLK